MKGIIVSTVKKEMLRLASHMIRMNNNVEKCQPVAQQGVTGGMRDKSARYWITDRDSKQLALLRMLYLARRSIKYYKRLGQ